MSAPQAAETKRRTRKDRTKNAEEAMSRYFNTKRPDETNGMAGAGQMNKLSSGLRQDVGNSADSDGSRSRSPLPPVELPERPFLGFGSSGMTSTSPIRVDRHQGRLCRTSSQSEAANPRRPSTASSSYYTWSTSVASASIGQHTALKSPPVEIRHYIRKAQKQKVAQEPMFDEPPEAITDAVPNQKLKEMIEDQARQKSTSEEASPDAPTFTNTMQAKDFALGDQVRRSGTSSRHPTSEPSSNNVTESVHREKAGKIEAHSVSESSDRAVVLEPKTDRERTLPLSFDTALERLLSNCQLPSLSVNVPPLDSFPSHEDAHQNYPPKEGKDGASSHNVLAQPQQDHTRHSPGTSSYKNAAKTDGNLRPPDSRSRPLTSNFSLTKSYLKSIIHHQGPVSEPRELDVAVRPPSRTPSRHVSDDFSPFTIDRHQRHTYVTPLSGIHATNVGHSYPSFYEDQMILEREPKQEQKHTLHYGTYRSHEAPDGHAYLLHDDIGDPQEDHYGITYDELLNHAEDATAEANCDNEHEWNPAVGPLNSEQSPLQQSRVDELALSFDQPTYHRRGSLDHTQLSPTSAEYVRYLYPDTRQTFIEDAGALEACWLERQDLSRRIPREQLRSVGSEIDAGLPADFWRPNRLY